MTSPTITLIGESVPFVVARDALRRIARTDATVLIEGETGTGKELAARVIHYEGRRSGGPFIPVNCGAIPEALVESELFGYRHGAFTDAKDDSPGVLMLARGGTLFLDEVDALSARAQVALLRFLQDRTVRPLGSSVATTIDVRIVCATNRTLSALVADHHFRHDLYFRLNVMHLLLPPLRARGADIDLFVNHYLRQLAGRDGRPVPLVNADSMAWLRAQPWPGNVRELENLLEREFLLGDGVAELTFGNAVPSSVSSAPEPMLSYRKAKARTVEDFDRRYLDRLLREAKGNVALAARTSGKERRDLSRLLRRYAISPAHFRSSPD